MKRLQAAALLGAVLAAGCADGPTTPRTRTSLEILEGGAPVDERTIAAGGTLRLQAEVTDGSGKVLPKTVEWKSTDARVATVDAGGVVSAAAATGTTQIIASVEGAADTATVYVAQPLSGTVACGPGDSALQLAVGEVFEVSAWDAPRLCVDGGDGSEYVLVPFHASATAEGQRLALEVVATGVRSVAGPPSPSMAPRPLERASEARGGGSLPDSDFHRRLRERALPGLERRMREMRRAGGEPAPSFSLAATGAIPRVGDVLRLNTQAQSGDGCENPVYRHGRVVALTQHSVVVADTANPAGGFTDEEYRAFGEEFDRIVYPLNVEHFGEPSDVDKNKRVTIFFTRAVNDMTTAGLGFYIGGFFFDRDLFPTSGSGACKGSNVAEMFYMMVPDPARTAREPAFSKTRVKERTLAVIGHEFQHLINASRRLHVNDAEEWEESWLNEGLSHIAEELLFYHVTGLQARQNLDGSDILRPTTTQAALRAYQLDNFERLVEHLGHPSASSPMGDADKLSTRGASWAFLRYLADRRAGSERDLWHRLVNSRTSGVRNLNQVTGVEALEWMQDWAVSVYTDDAGFAVAPRHQQPSWNYRALYPELQPLLNTQAFRYPLSVYHLSSGASQRPQLHSGGAAYLRFGVAAGQRAAVQTTTSGGLPAPPKVRLTLVRTK